MEAFARFLAHEQDLEARFSDFLASLDQGRTATLSQVLRCEGTGKLDAGWLNIRLLTLRLESCCNFFSLIADHPWLYGWSQMPLIFFQKVDPEEERKWHEELLNDDDLSNYRHRYGRYNPDNFHLHTEVSWVGILRPSGSMFPLRPFTSRGLGGEWRQRPMILGYWLPDYPRILGVSNSIATDYLARILIHDIGHGFIPSPPPEREDLHAVTMQYALGMPPIVGSNMWERLVHAEAVNPYFFLTSEEEIRYAWRFGHQYMESSTQWHLLQGLRKMYSSQENKARERLWKVDRLKTLDRKEYRIKETIRDMIATGFANYDPFKQV
jgi:hypothetical protein